MRLQINPRSLRRSGEKRRTMASPRVRQFEDGVVIRGDCMSPEVLAVVLEFSPFPLVLADPPYGGIVSDEWDKIQSDVQHAAWMVSWCRTLQSFCWDGAALYGWGGYGTPENRPFYRFVVHAEVETAWNMAMMVTWRKRRAYGVQHNYLSTREECAYFVKGDVKKPRCFNIPLLDKERGYAGYDERYPAKSKYLRRTAVWDDVTEILRGKLVTASGKKATAQKPVRLCEIPIEVHTEAGEWVFDPFAGTGTTGVAARKLGRRFVLVERDEEMFELCCERLAEKSDTRSKKGVD
jgi:DNA modification methylase